MNTSEMIAAAEKSSCRRLQIQLSAEARDGNKKGSRRSISCQNLDKVGQRVYSQSRPALRDS
jgi:hypothetical protein